MTPAQIRDQIAQYNRLLRMQPTGSGSARDCMEAIDSLEAKLAASEAADNATPESRAAAHRRDNRSFEVYTDEEISQPGWQHRRPELARAIANRDAMKETPGRPGHYYNPAFGDVPA